MQTDTQIPERGLIAALIACALNELHEEILLHCSRGRTSVEAILQSTQTARWLLGTDGQPMYENGRVVRLTCAYCCEVIGISHSELKWFIQHRWRDLGYMTKPVPAAKKKALPKNEGSNKATEATA